MEKTTLYLVNCELSPHFLSLRTNLHSVWIKWLFHYKCLTCCQSLAYLNCYVTWKSYLCKHFSTLVSLVTVIWENYHSYLRLSWWVDHPLFVMPFKLQVTFSLCHCEHTLIEEKKKIKDQKRRLRMACRKFSSVIMCIYNVIDLRDDSRVSGAAWLKHQCFGQRKESGMADCPLHVILMVTLSRIFKGGRNR